MVEQYYQTKNYEARRSIAYLVRHASNLATTKIEALFVEQDITFIQWVVMMNLRDKLAGTCAEICQNIRHDSGALTRVIDQLEQRGLVERQRSTEDRRMVELTLTPLGLETVESLIPLVVDLYNGWFEDFSKQEADTLIQLMTKLTARISNSKAGG